MFQEIRLTFNAADRESNQVLVKKLWQITIDLPNSPKYFTAKVFFCTVAM